MIVSVPETMYSPERHLMGIIALARAVVVRQVQKHHQTYAGYVKLLPRRVLSEGP